jgi:hypothetical protein
MLFEETAPAGTETTFHLHRDSDEVAYVLSGEITFKIGDEVTVGGPGTCAFLPRGVPHAWKNTGAEAGRVLFLYTPAGAGGFFEEQLARPAESVRYRKTLASLPTRSPSQQPRPARKAGFSTFENNCGRETDCLLEGDGFELLVPRHEKPVAQIPC